MNPHSSLVEVPFGWPVVLYLGLAAIAAGSALFGCWSLLRGALERGRRSLLVAISTIVVGLLCLVVDLESPGRFLAILQHFNPASMIAWGVRGVSLFVILATFMWWTTGRSRAGSFAVSAPLRFGLVLLGGLAIFVGLYPAWVLAQATARPLWSSPFIAPLFLVSALHAGIATYLVVRPERDVDNDRIAEPAVEVGLVMIQACALALFLFGIGDAYGGARARLLTGSLAPSLWLGVVAIGWLVPLVLVRGRQSNINMGLRAIAILVGVFALRAVVVFGGQGMAAIYAGS